ncbi:MAG: discoidin domain-containing protein [Gemmatimonadota bacterium]
MLTLCALLLAAAPRDTTPQVIDTFDRTAEWSAHPADGVALSLHPDRGHRGGALRLDFGFSGGGYAIARRPVSIDLSGNYAFTFWIRGVSAPNTLEFKLIDSSGENVWWYTERDRRFTGEWEQITIRKRQISFAWGPAGGGLPSHIASLELVVTAGAGGGKGSVWFDDLMLTPLPEYGPYTATPLLRATASAAGHPASNALDGDTTTSWRAPGLRSSVTIDFRQPREFGGLSLSWEAAHLPVRYRLLDSRDGTHWRLIGNRVPSRALHDHFYLPDHDARYLRLDLEGAANRQGVGLRELRIDPLEAGASRNAFLAMVARDAPRGRYPRYLLGERGDWTVVGVDGAPDEALLGEDGALEAGTGAFSVEPFLFLDGRLLSWSDVQRNSSLEAGRLPIPSVRWQHEGVTLDITTAAIGGEKGSSALVRYLVTNEGTTSRRGRLLLAVRPFQVNPPWQFLGTPGGWSRIDSLGGTIRRLSVNGNRLVRAITPAAGFGAIASASGDVTDYLARGILPPWRVARDPQGAASGALAWDFTLAPGAVDTVFLEIPMPTGAGAAAPPRTTRQASAAMQREIDRWATTLNGSGIDLPGTGERISNTIASTLGYILINRDGPAIQPGSRSYERSWIRDGALTSTALLRFGHADVVRRFLLWYAPFQYPNGKVPCCVDHRGADPVAEHDSHGEFIYLVMEYFRHTGDRAVLEQMWPHVVAAVGYLDSLRQSERTAAYRQGDSLLYFGLLPPSISHEGYSAKPMHSYWDDFFALRGFKDATAMAAVLGHQSEAERFAKSRDEFANDLYASIDRVMAARKIDFIPGAADLGDFDATSTTIAISPVEELPRLPKAAINATFERYWREASARKDPASTWEAYTPYELRTVGALLRLDRRMDALTMLDAFLADQEPVTWNQWPEVVWRDRRAPKFIGDLPHTWVGSDFLRSAADLFVYERESDSALVLAQGISDAWLGGSGVVVRNLSTWWGPLNYTARRVGLNRVEVEIKAGTRIPPGGLLLYVPGSWPKGRATINGVPVEIRPRSPAGGFTGSNGPITIRTLPATVVFEP